MRRAAYTDCRRDRAAARTFRRCASCRPGPGQRCSGSRCRRSGACASPQEALHGLARRSTEESGLAELWCGLGLCHAEHARGHGRRRSTRPQMACALGGYVTQPLRRLGQAGVLGTIAAPPNPDAEVQYWSARVDRRDRPGRGDLASKSFRQSRMMGRPSSTARVDRPRTARRPGPASRPADSCPHAEARGDMHPIQTVWLRVW